MPISGLTGGSDDRSLVKEVREYSGHVQKLQHMLQRFSGCWQAGSEKRIRMYNGFIKSFLGVHLIYSG